MTTSTLTLQQTAVRFRLAGIATSPNKIRAGIEQGVYPFGICIDLGKSKVYEIYTAQVEAWIKERAK